MLVTSTEEVFAPSAADFIFVFLNQAKCLIDFVPGKSDMLGEFNSRFKPKFGLSILALNMDVHSRLFTRKEIKPEATFSKYCWTHCSNDTRDTW